MKADPSTAEWLEDEHPDDRVGRKRDRLARLLRVASILYTVGSGEQGVQVTEIARLTGMTTRTVYRDINALDQELGIPIFSAGRGRFGIEHKYFLPPLRLSVPEAIVLFLAARLIARWSDEYDQAVVSAFTKLASRVRCGWFFRMASAASSAFCSAAEPFTSPFTTVLFVAAALAFH